MRSKSKVLVSADPTRIEVHPFEPSEPLLIWNQAQNLRRLAGAIRWPIQSLLGASAIECRDLSRSPAFRALAREFYQRADRSAESWANRHLGLFAENYESVEPTLAGYLEEIYGDSDLVIGYELSPGLRNWLTLRGIKFVNVSIHALRFLPDLVLLVTSNSESLLAAIDGFSVEPHEVESAVDTVTALSASCQNAIPWLPDETLIVAGQTWADQTVISEGRFLNLLDYGQEVRNEAAQAAFTVILPHPYGDPAWRVEAELLAMIGPRAMVASTNAYALLADKRVSRVLTIGSGLGREARCFGKDVSFLLEDPVSRFERRTAGSVALPGNAIRTSRFWSSVFTAIGLDVAIPPAEAPQHQLPPFRDLIGLGWSFSGLSAPARSFPRRRLVNLGALQSDAEDVVRDTFKLVVDSENLRKDEVAYHARTINHLGRSAFFREMLSSEPARQLNVSDLEIIPAKEDG